MLRQDKINALIPLAIETIESVKHDGDKIVNNGKIKKVYEGYISAFGSNLNQSGLLPTLVFYQKTKGDGKRILWSKAIYKMLTNKDSGRDDDLIKYVIKASTGKDSGTYKIGDLKLNTLDDIEEQIIDIAIALKLAVRTFPIVNDNKKTKENGND